MYLEWLKLFIILMIMVMCGCNVVDGKNVMEINSNRGKRNVVPDGNNQNSCENVKGFFQMRNISFVEGSKGMVCGGQCCDDRVEAELRKQGQKDFASLLRHNSRSLQGLLSFTAATLQNHVSDLSHQSENKTLLLFAQVYQGMAILSKEPIRKLYSDIRNYILTNTTTQPAGNIGGSSGNGGGSSSSSISSPLPPTIDITNSVTQFFTDFFPLVYHYILHNTANKDFAADYKNCLKKTIDTVLPFGDIPKQISQSLSKSLEATRLLLQAFSIGTEVLNTTDKLLIDESGKTNTECHDALLKMNYCPKCQGLTKHAKPCSGYCLNVLRGCLTKYVAELDSPWNGYVEGIESLVNAMKKNNGDGNGANADSVIKTLDTRISEAIMYAMEKGQDINTKVQRNCGQAVFTENENPLITESTPQPMTMGSKPRSTNPRIFVSLPETELLHFLTSIAKTRGFYGNLADTLCQDESFAEPKDQRCWNGERIAEYTKTVVDVGLDMQKYNPEVKPSTNLQNVDPHVADLVDKLRHVHHMAMTSVGTSVNDLDYMQRDGAEGSGSGGGSDFEDNDDDTRGSGSGYGHIEDEERQNPKTNTKVIKEEQPTVVSNTNGGDRVHHPQLLLLIISVLFGFYYAI